MISAQYAVRIEAPEAGPGESDAAQDLDIVVAQEVVTVESLEDARIPVFLTLPRDEYEGAFPLIVVVEDVESGSEKRVDITFRGP